MVPYGQQEDGIANECVQNQVVAGQILAELAATDSKHTWRLSGKYIIGADPAGVPQPELTFKVNAKNRTMLLAVPRAEVVDRPG